MRKNHSRSGAFAPLNKTMAMLLGAALFAAATAPALAQSSSVEEYGEVPGVKGKAEAMVKVDQGNYATVIAVAQASGGTPQGKGVITRAGIGVDIYVGDEICTADRDIRRQVDVDTFKGKFATSATCMTVLPPGEHKILAEKTEINVTGSKMTLKYTILGGKPERIVRAKQ
jgi:hypothetical protein